jgi:telomere length regulation protein
MDAHVVALSRRGRFIQAVQAYLSHPDAKIRRLGMLVAEIVSERSVEEGGVPAGLGVVEKDDVEDLVAGLEVDEETGESKQPKRANAKPLRGPKRLQFTGMWDGDGEGRTEARWLRAYVGVRDGEAVLSDDAAAWMLGWDVPPPAAEPAAPAPEPTRGRRPEPKPKADRSKARAKPPPKIVMLDDDQVADPLQGYASSPSSSRSPSPTPEYLAEVAADPTLAVDATKKRKLKRPVYVRQLAELLRDKDKPDSIELALQWGEGLVRAKRNFGTEVSENAVAVAAAALALANPFNLDDFEVRRQGLVTALVACSPRNVPP